MKRVISILLTVTLMFAVIPMGNLSANAASYNAAAALSYAEKTWDNGVEMCAGYVSNCLQAGGINVMERRVSNLYNALKGTYGTPYILRTSGPYIYYSDNSDRLAAGDPVFYYCDSCNSFQHAILCGGFDSSGRMTDYAHNNAHHNTTTYISWGCPECGAIDWIMYSVHVATSTNLNSNSNANSNSTQTYKVTYNANGGSNAPAAQTKTQGKNLTLSSSKPSRSGYTFKCWNTKSDGSGTSYNAGSTYSANANVTLYAIWTKAHAHSYTKKITKAATCSNDGVATFTCSCGSSYTETIKATGHTVVWVYSRRPSIYRTGLKHKECSSCHAKLSADTTVAKATGDVNGDGRTNSTDAMTILKHSTGYTSLLSSESKFINGDVNGDGSVNSLDALIILQISTGSLSV